MSSKKLLISIISSLVFGATVAMAAGIPENMTGLKATAVDSASIGLTWKAAKDGDGGLVKNYRVYYGTFSVLERGSGEYEKQVDTPNNNTSFVVTGLEPSTKYYFAATAISSDNKESAEYSLEASATTLAASAEGGVGSPVADTTSPTVTSVSAPDKLHVKVVFSEAVQLPASSAEASFGIVEQINPANELSVVSAVMDPADGNNKTVLLETSEQKPNVNYIVTAGVAIKDLANNPIVSGSTDSGLFLGSSKTPVVASEEPETGEILTPTPTETPTPTATAVECNQDLLCWVSHMADCSLANVSETDEGATTEYKVEITGSEEANCTVKYTATKHPNVLFAGSDMTCKVAKGTYATMEDYNKVVDTKNCVGELVEGYKTLIHPAAKDTTPPENITNMLLTFKKELEKFTIMLSWTPSINTAKDLMDQILYMSMDRGKNYDAGKPLGPIVAKTDVANLEGGKEYTFKVTTKDTAGNESTGVVKSIRLPQTGAGIGFLIFGSAWAAKRALRRKKNGEI